MSNENDMPTSGETSGPETGAAGDTVAEQPSEIRAGSGDVTESTDEAEPAVAE